MHQMRKGNQWRFGMKAHPGVGSKVRYRGLKKNQEWLCAGFALVNLYQYRKRLAQQGA